MTERSKKVAVLGTNILGIASALFGLVPFLNQYRLHLIIISVISFLSGTIYLVVRGYRIIGYVRRPIETLESELKNVDEVWCMWHTGSVNKARGMEYIKKIRYRIILTKPFSSAMEELGKMTVLNFVDLNRDVEKFYEIMKIDRLHDVRFLNGLLGSAIIIANPEQEDKGWIRIESLVPELDPKDRPSLKFYAKRDKELFHQYKEMFDKLWEDKCIKDYKKEST